MSPANPRLSPPDARLKRFLYLSNESRTFITGNSDTHGHYTKELVPCIDQLLVASPDKVANIVQIVNGKGCIPTRDTLFFTLAAAVNTCIKLENKDRMNLYTTVLAISKDDKDFFKFIKYISLVDKTFSSGIKKIVTKHYLNKDPADLVRDIGMRTSHHGWSHKDLIKLSHIKTDSILTNTIITYMLKGMKEAEKVATEEESKEILEFFKKCEMLKKSKSEDEVATLLKELKFGVEEVPAIHNKSIKVWESLLETIELQELLPNVLRLYKIGFLKADSPNLTKVVEILTNVENVKKSKVHPVDVFITLRNFEKGGRPKDPKLIRYLEEKEALEHVNKEDEDYKKPNFAHVEPTKCPAIVSALNKTLMLSYQNIESTGKRYLITLDMNEVMMKRCITTGNVTCLEAGVLLAISFLKSEKNVTVAVFSEKSITPVALDKGGSVSQAIKKLGEVAHGLEMYGAPMKWAADNKKQFDAFINIHSAVGNFTREAALGNPLENLKQYKAAMNMSNSKLIMCSFAGVKEADYGENTLLVCGFDRNVPRIINAFMQNLF